MAFMSTRIEPRRRAPPLVSCASSAMVRVSCEILPSFNRISPKRSSRRVSEASTIRPSCTWICAVPASERMVITPLFSPPEMTARSSGRLRSRRLPTRAIGFPVSRRGNLVLAGLLGGIERHVGGFEELAGGGSRLRERGDAHAHRDGAGVHQREGLGLDRLLDA